MKNELLSIGKMAQLNHISEQTLRHYEKEGLLTPKVTDPKTGYRYYTVVQSAKIDFIQRMKQYGLSLQEIKIAAETKDDNYFHVVLQKHLDEYETLSKEIESKKKAIQTCIENNDRYRSLQKNHSIFLEKKNARIIYSYRADREYLSAGYDVYESVLRELKSELEHIGGMWLSQMKAGSIIRKKSLENGHLLSDTVFVLVDDTISGSSCEYLEDSFYCCICCRGFDNEIESCQKLLQYIHENQYKICGDCLIERIVDFPTYNNDRRDAFSEIQIPVTFE